MRAALPTTNYDGRVTDATPTDAPTLAADTVYEDDKALDVIGYLISLKRYLVPALVVAALVLGLGAAYALTRPAKYTARATVSLVPGEVKTEAEAVQQAAMMPMVARNYSQMSNSPLVLDPAAAMIDPTGELKGADLKEGLRVGWPANSLMLNFDVTADSEENAIKRLNAIVNSFNQRVPETSGDARGVSLSSKTVYIQEGPIEPDPSETPQLLAMALVASVALGFLTAVALDLTLGRRQRRRLAANSSATPQR